MIVHWYSWTREAVLVLLVLLLAFSLSHGLNKKEKRKIFEGGENNHPVEFPPEWHLWKSQHGKVYQDEREELKRHIVWQANKKHIDDHNKYADVFGYTLKMNQFGDLSNREFVEGFQCVQERRAHNASQLNAIYRSDKFLDFKLFKDEYTYPESFDWRTGGAVTKVKDQLRCGCSYAFSATGAIEGVVALKKGNLLLLSPQNIVDCSISYGNRGCACGDVNSAFLYVIENGGIDTWNNYPYQANQYSCEYSKSYSGTAITGVVTIPSGDEERLLAAVASTCPVSTYVDASTTSFQFYSSGVMDVAHCSSTSLSHALLIIGYGTTDGTDYWLLKNSWGPHWGESGYIKMARNRNNQCGIATAASYPTS